MKSNELQESLKAAVTAFLREVGVEDVREKKKVVRLEDEEEGEASELQLCLSFDLEGDAFEVWLYPEGAGINEPGDEWYSFDLQDYDSEAELVRAVVAHLESLFED